MRHIGVFSIVTLLTLLVFAFAGSAGQTLSVGKARGPEGAALFGREVTVEGYYYDRSIPMIVDDPGRVLIDMPMPKEAYLPLVGPRPMGVGNGDRVAGTGTLVVPQASDPPEVRGEPAVLRLKSPEDVKVIRKADGSGRSS